MAGAQTPPPTETSLTEVQIRDDLSAQGYQGQPSQTAATRTETPLIETPQSVRVVPQALMEDLGARRLADTVDYVSGVTRLNDFGGTWDNYAIRGFSNTDGGQLLNGFASNRGYGPQRDVASVERIEFLKGPAAALYGSSEPGGTLNVVTKKPQFRSAHQANVQVGGLGYRRATLDSTGPLSEQLAYRLNLAAEDGASRSTLVDNRKMVVAPSLTWKLSPQTVLNYEAEFIRIRTPLDRGIVQVNGNVSALPSDRFLGDPSRGNLQVNGDTHQLTLDHELGAGWRTRWGASHRSTELYGSAVDLIGSLAANGRTLTRRDSWRSLPAQDTSLQAELEGKLQAGGFRHTVLAGVETWRLVTEQNINYSNLATQPFAIDIYNPVYNQAAGTLTPGFSLYDRQRAAGLFVQDQIDLSTRWKLLAGLRLDRFHQDSENRLTATRQVQTHTATTPRLGLTYLIDPNTSVYASAGRSFRPNAGTDERGQAFAPQQGQALEVGAKWQSPDQALMASVALFDIRKTNVLTRSPTNANYSVAAGEVRSRGLELDAAGQLNRHWRLTSNFAYTDAEVTRDNNPALLGKRLLNIPRVSAGLFAMREDLAPWGGRYGVGGGLVHVGERTGTATDTYRLPAYTTARVSSYWQMDKRTRLTLDVHNLFNQTYYTASWGALTVIPGLGRQLVAGLQVAF
ncbi:TonB-dependent siderophore receptor [Curvibacter sp. HBC61]|uniref:TonB-dependent siderophore receptor n=1 Tax=Curvibacter cyanobacteriorum TaxID=3026422 RepID=A0ABT5MW34_9BURK|nr:TonB-dependent siderophore receptor [Curvibacter sp. HBC61]MDD0838260.1 TonB-dependent siderophore receptor [Curvibacter sp. HBC61]